MKEKFYITTTLPYINSEPHIGFAAEIIRADCLARWHRILGDEVFFNTGTDEHGLKIFRKAEELGISVQDYCDQIAEKYKELKNLLNLSWDNFIRTTDDHHIKAAQEFWLKCKANGDIYKKTYKVKYCVGCELEKTDSELDDNGCCPLHPGKPLEIIEEENYFFRFSKYQEKLLELYTKNPAFVYPDNRLHEIKNFVESGLQDFSISRLKEKMPWGVAVPDDPDHIMYVWFDALVNYIAAIGWPEDNEMFSQFWPGMQVAGKDNLRQQSSMWQAMLMSAGLPVSRQILIFGFITSGGQKMSKSIGNVVSPVDLVNKYGQDATRYYLLAEITPFEDGDFTYEKFEERYNADLANGIGNLVARVSNLLEKNSINLDLETNFDINKKIKDSSLFADYNKFMLSYSFNEAVKILIAEVKKCDEILTAKAPWKMTNQDEIKSVLAEVSQNIYNIAFLLQPFLPNAAEKILAQFSAGQIKKGESLFPRISAE